MELFAKIVNGFLSLIIFAKKLYRRYLTVLQPIKCQCHLHIEIIQLIFCANQLTGFYTRATLAFNGLNTPLKTLTFIEPDEFLLLLWQ